MGDDNALAVLGLTLPADRTGTVRLEVLCVEPSAHASSITGRPHTYSSNVLMTLYSASEKSVPSMQYSVLEAIFCRGILLVFLMTYMYAAGCPYPVFLMTYMVVCCRVSLSSIPDDVHVCCRVSLSSIPDDIHGCMLQGVPIQYS